MNQNEAVQKDVNLILVHNVDDDCYSKDSSGNMMFLFSIEWKHNGGSWGAQIYAYDWADAEKRVQSMMKSLQVVGQVMSHGSLADLPKS